MIIFPDAPYFRPPPLSRFRRSRHRAKQHHQSRIDRIGNRGSYTGQHLRKIRGSRLPRSAMSTTRRLKARGKITGGRKPRRIRIFKTYSPAMWMRSSSATPVYLHPDHFEAAVKSGKHIYIEKPAGMDVAGLQTRDPSGRQCGSQDQHHFRIPAALRRRLCEGEADAGRRRDRQSP